MSEPPWTSADPPPGDFDTGLESADPSQFVRLAPNPDAKSRFIIDIDAPDFERLQRIAMRRREAPREVVAALIQAADRPGASTTMTWQ